MQLLSALDLKMATLWLAIAAAAACMISGIVLHAAVRLARRLDAGAAVRDDIRK